MSGETSPCEIDDEDDHGDCSSRHGGCGPECEDEPIPARESGRESGAGVDEGYHRSSEHGDNEGGRAEEGAGGRWAPEFLEAELRETCLGQLEIPVGIGSMRSVQRSGREHAAIRCVSVAAWPSRRAFSYTLCLKTTTVIVVVLMTKDLEKNRNAMSRFVCDHRRRF